MHRMLRLFSLLLTFSIFAFAQHAPTAATSLASIPWEFIGPTNIQGRVLCVAVNPLNSNTIYAGTAGSGLWRSRTAGRGGNWQRIPLGLPAAGVGAIAIDPADSNTIYIGTGEVYRYRSAVGPSIDRSTQGSYGYGLLKTTNGGASWSQSIAWQPSDQRAVQVIRLNPENRRTIYAGTTEGLYLSTDAGGSWTLTLDIKMVQDIVVNSTDTTFVMASCGILRSPDLGVYLSDNGGSGWFRLDGFPTYTGKARLEPFAGDGNVVFATVGNDTGARGAVFKTTDFGASWDTVRGGRLYPIGWYAHFVAVHPQAQNLLVIGSQLLYATSDAGLNLTEVGGTHDIHLNYAHDPLRPDRIYVTTEGGLFVSDDFGYNYDNISTGLITAQLQSGFSNSESDPNFAVCQAAGNEGVTYRGSQTWTASQGNEAGWTAIDPSNDSVIYRGWMYGINVVRSTDRDATYNNGSLLGGGGGGGGIFEFEPAAWNAPLVISRSSPATLFLGRSKIMKTTDAGDNWTSASGILDGNLAVSMAMSATSAETLYVGMAPLAAAMHIFRTTNMGGSWQNVSGTLPNRVPLDLAVDPHNSAVVYAAYDGYGISHLFKTSDAGTSWTDISAGLPDAPIAAVVVDPLSSNMVYAAGDANVYVSTDAGASWSAFNTALPEGFIVADLTISSANRKLRMVTRGAGVYQHDLFAPSTAALAVDLRGGWNLISLPVNAINSTPGAQFPTALPGTVFRYDGQYIAAADLEPGKAYWAKFPGGTTSQQVSGPSLQNLSVSLKKGWNLVGSIDHEVPAPSGGIIESSWFEFTASGYAVAATLKPGHGYWLKANAAGTITLGAN
jgi:photosystem II stability/assembly factor-like uncharacterized protein